MMEISSPMYLPEFGMEDPTLFEQYPMDYFDGLDFQSLVSESYSSYECPNSKITQSPESIAPPAPRPSEKLKTNKAASNSSPKLISFGHSNMSSVANSHQFYNLDSNVKLETLNENILDFASLSCQGAYYKDTNFIQCEKQTNKAGTVTRNPLQAQDHVMTERRRREKLNQKFIALSSIIPGLKKMDKASVLGGAIDYVKKLQEREKILEEQVAMKTKESAVLLRRSILFADDDNSSSDEKSDCRSHQPLAEIESRVFGKDVLIRMLCEKHNGCEATILRELEKLHLTVQSSSILPFGKTTLCVTIVAQMDEEHCMTPKDFVESLRKALALDRT